jgi:hypothetical protein
MHDMPEHLMMPVNAEGQGPVTDAEASAYACWCGTECGLQQHIYSATGTLLCEDMKAHDAEPALLGDVKVLPGYCPACAGYSVGLLRLLAAAQGHEEDES